MDDNLLLYRGPERSNKTLDELKALGVDRVRVSLHWRAIAPNHRSTRKPRPLRYPEGNFAPHDHLLRAARARGIAVLVNVTGGAPLWATGRRNGKPVSLQYKPDPDEFARFMAMLGRRYDGRRHPRITAWSIWNEPNQGALLQPQWENGRMASPRIYRSLVRAAERGLQASGHDDDIVLLARRHRSATIARASARRSGPARSCASSSAWTRTCCPW
jgi:beta-glucosidase/6-phospho-beta-glucosidase/beta-galactosidase